jgi:hypothetical protein
MDRRKLLVSGAMMLGATSCGYILYPGRRGRTGGRIDIPVLIIDILWFIPGIVPGLVCLIVDFASGCIYEGGGRGRTSSPPSGTESREATVEIELDGAIVATGKVAPDRKASLTWSRQVDEATLRARAHVSVRTSDGAVARAELSSVL